MSNKFYYPQLDSIRGLSFISIFLFHVFQLEFIRNNLGDFAGFCFERLPFAIDVFFILSSFLLTLIGLKEYGKTGSFSFRKFFTRRILRIWPLYYMILFFSFAIFPFLASRFGYGMSLPGKWHYIFFVSNFYLVDHVFFLRILWTLSVEEQFYFVLGICLKFFRRFIAAIFYLFILFSIGFTVYAMYSGTSRYFHTLTYFFDFSVGGLAAYFYYHRNSITEKFANLTKPRTILFYMYLPFHFMVFYFIEKTAPSNFAELLNRYLFIIYIALLIIEQLQNANRLRFLQKNPFLILTGKISFGLYCFHGMVVTALNIFIPKIQVSIPIVPFALIAFAINFLIAYASYYLFELHFLKLKDRLRRI